jgi:hypothetical protein
MRRKNSQKTPCLKWQGQASNQTRYAASSLKTISLLPPSGGIILVWPLVDADVANRTQRSGQTQGPRCGFSNHILAPVTTSSGLLSWSLALASPAIELVRENRAHTDALSPRPSKKCLFRDLVGFFIGHFVNVSTFNRIEPLELRVRWGVFSCGREDILAPLIRRRRASGGNEL